LFTIKDLGTLGGTTSWGLSVNNSGQVAGASYSKDNVMRAFLWNGATMTDIGVLSGNQSDSGAGYGINNLGQITGASGNIASPLNLWPNFSGDPRAFLWESGVMKGMGTLSGGTCLEGSGYSTWYTSKAAAFGINDLGHVTGFSCTSDPNTYHAFLWNGTTMQDIGILPAQGYFLSVGFAINNRDQITGASTCTVSDPELVVYHAFFWNGQTMQDIGTLGALESFGEAINDAGQIAGFVWDYSYSNVHAFFWNGTTMMDIGDGYSHGINNLGQIVGESGHAFFWDGSTMWDLNNQLVDQSGWTVLTSAQAINDVGQITGYGTIAGQVHAFLLTPVTAGGTVSVVTDLPAAAFTITGPANYSGSGTSFTQTNAPAGTYTITYGAVNCYSTPPPETKTLTAGGVLTFSGGTYQGRASITVSVAPGGATSATFSINPPVPGMPSTGPYPRVQSNVWPQSYTVAFNSVMGFTPPAAQTLSPNSSCQLNFAGTYVPVVSPGMATLSVTVSSNTNSLGKFTIADSQGRVIASSVSSFGVQAITQVAAGKYTIKYVPLAGFYTPPDRTLVLNANDVMHVTGKYRRLILVSFTGCFNSPYALDGTSACAPLSLNCGGLGITYPDNLLSCSGRGMTNIILEARGLPAPFPGLVTSVLAPGLASRAFTFYDDQGSPCVPPSGEPGHATAEAWVRSLNPTPDDVIVVVGHSYGGNRARVFADQLRANQVRPNARFATDALFTVDPVDWTTCNVASIYWNPLHLGDPSCFQAGFPHELPQSVGLFRAFTETNSQSLIWGYPIMVGGIIQYQFLTNFTDVGHDGIDDDPRVHQFILDALSGLVRGPKALTAGIAGTPFRDSSGLRYPIQVTATAFGTATGFGTAMGVRITSASLNGVPATSVLPSSILGDIPAGSASSPVTLLFPAAAAAKGAAVLLTITFENCDGAPYTNTIRQVAP